eukprot:m.37381 g.37381  ORF g.37381 m.37381 type:complete len:99 (-) comp9308_c1_seq1:90-386(-)
MASIASINILPNEILVHILTFAISNSVGAVFQVCKRWTAVLQLVYPKLSESDKSLFRSTCLALAENGNFSILQHIEKMHFPASLGELQNALHIFTFIY